MRPEAQQHINQSNNMGQDVADIKAYLQSQPWRSNANNTQPQA